MADVVIFEQGKAAKLLKSVNTPDYSGPGVVINPDLSALGGTQFKYWKRDGDNVVEMTQAEKDVVDADILSVENVLKEVKAESFSISAIDLAKALVKLGLVTKPQLKAALKEVM